MIQSVRTGRVLLKPPYRKDERLPEVEINTVLVEEINPPEGEEPITWLLLTSLPVDTFETSLSRGGILPLPMAGRDIF